MPTRVELRSTQFPDDRSLPGLSLIAQPERLATVLSTLLADSLGSRARVKIIETRLLRYVPQKRCIVQLACAVEHHECVQRRSLIVKLYAHDKCASVYATLQDLFAHGFDSGRLTITPALGYDPTYHLLLLPHIAGERLRELLLAPAPDVSLVDGAAEWLLKLHRCGVTSGRRYDFARHLHTLALWQRRLAETLPSLGPLAAEVWQRIQARGSELTNWPSAPTHRDFSPDHLLIDGERVTALDFDEFCQYDPLFDVAHFVVHLRWLALVHFGALTHYDVFAARFENHYAAHARHFSSARMRLHKAIAYFKLAHIGALITQPAQWPVLSELLLQEAREHSRS